MKKKTIAIIAALIVGVIVICVCTKGNSSQYTVICNDGTIEKMSADELSELYDDELLYKQKYEGAHVRGKGKIVNVEADGWASDRKTIITVRIRVDSICTYVSYVPADYAENYSVGDEFEVSGTLNSDMSGFANIKADDFYRQ